MRGLHQECEGSRWGAVVIVEPSRRVLGHRRVQAQERHIRAFLQGATPGVILALGHLQNNVPEDQTLRVVGLRG
jgi:hypothetical protein